VLIHTYIYVSQHETSGYEPKEDEAKMSIA